MYECSTLCSANISVLLAGLTSQKTQRTVGNWRSVRSWRRPRLLPPSTSSSRLSAWLQPGWDRPLRELEKRGCLPVSLLRQTLLCRFTMGLWTKRAAGIIVVVALLLSRMTAEGEHSFPHFPFFLFLFLFIFFSRRRQPESGLRRPGGGRVYRATLDDTEPPVLLSAGRHLDSFIFCLVKIG